MSANSIRGIYWSIFWNGLHLGDWPTREASEIVQVFIADIDIFAHRIDLC
jgi:hypothetical protein